MATNLYEALGVNRNATTEEIRKAYRRKALETHPDRLPQGATAADKSISEEMFRKINNAYEVLHDPQTRAAYDKYGVWPPPAPTPQGPTPSGPHDPFSDSFFRDPFFNDHFFRGPRMDPFAGGFQFGPRHPGPRDFTDPFVLFNSIFGDFQRAFESDPFFDDHSFGHRGVGSNHFGGGFFNNGFPSMMSTPFGGGGMGNSRMQTFSSSGSGNGGRWISQSWSSSTVNGVTHTRGVRRDSDGNEHVFYQYPDGTERRTINGMGQSSAPPPRALPAPAMPAPAMPAPPAPHVSGSARSNSMPPPPTYYEAVAQPPSRSHPSRHHTHFYDSTPHKQDDKDKHGHKHGRERERGRAHEGERSAHGHHGDRYGQDAQHVNASAWKFGRS